MKNMLRAFCAVLIATFPLLGFAADANCPELSALQRAAGYLSWIGFLQTLGIGLVAAGVLFVFRGVVFTILNMVGLMEVLLWALTLGLIGGTPFVNPSYQSWTLAIGALLLPGAFMLSAHYRHIKLKEVQSLFFLTILWGAIALYFGSSFVGFVTVGAFLAFLGFSVVVTPFCYAFGFADDDAVNRGTTAGLLVMTAYILVRAFNVQIGNLAVFATGALWLGSFVGFLGLLIQSSAYYKERNWAVANVFTIVAFIATISAGMLLNIREVTTIAGAFLLFYVADKILEIRTKDTIALGVKLIITGVALGCVWQWLRTNQDFVTRYLGL